MRGGMQGMFAAKQLKSDITRLNDAVLSNELAFLGALSQILTPEQAAKLAAAIKPSGGLVADDPGGASSSAVELLAASAAEARTQAAHTYVLKFFGDVTASQVATLRQEVTAVLGNADAEGRGDEVVLVLNTGGGTVTGYGLAAAQLTRLK